MKSNVKYLVTGAAGFLGGTICRQLTERRDDVRAFVLPGDPAAFEYPGILIYAMAVYTFAKIISAIMNLIRRRRDEDRILAAARCVSFAGALMSILALQTTLISQFGKSEELFAKVMTGVSGCAVLVILIALSVAMLVKSRNSTAH